jgi:hypothetical protein
MSSIGCGGHNFCLTGHDKYVMLSLALRDRYPTDLMLVDQMRSNGGTRG